MPDSPDNYNQSRGNAITHGFYATDELFLAHLKAPERRRFNRLRDALHAEYHPQTVREKILVDRLAILHFRQYRMYTLEAQAADQSNRHLLGKGSILSHLDRFSRYDWRIERQIRMVQNRLYQLYSKRNDYSVGYLKNGD